MTLGYMTSRIWRLHRMSQLAIQISAQDGTSNKYWRPPRRRFWTYARARDWSTRIHANLDILQIAGDCAAAFLQLDDFIPASSKWQGKPGAFEKSVIATNASSE